MYPVLFHVGSFAVRSYDMLVFLGMVAALSLTHRRARSAGLGGGRVVAGGVGIILIGIVGSRLGNVIIDLGRYISNWREVFSLYGTGFQGGFLFGMLGMLGLARCLRISFWNLADLFAPGLVLAQAIGRVGCFLNGCCYGRPTDSFLGVYLPGWGADWAYRYPTQLMHTAADLIILALLLKADRRRPFAGCTFLLYAILYSTQRLLIDFLRETGPLFAGVRASELVSVTTILVAGAVLGWKWIRLRREWAVQAKLADFYGQLQDAARRKDWAEVLALGGRIDGLAPGHRDVAALTDEARAYLSRPPAGPRPAAEPPQALSARLGLGRGAGALIAALVLVLWVVRSDLATLSPGDTMTRATDGAVMLYVPGGTFQMGSTGEDVDYALQLCSRRRDHCKRDWFEDEMPRHDVTLDGFWIDRTEVTNEQFAAFLNARGNQTEAGLTWLNIDDEECLVERVDGEYRPRSGYAAHPVVEVTWYGAADYCAWAGGRLPTESEWEYAASGPAGNVYPWGDAFDGVRLNLCDANCSLNWFGGTEYDDGYSHTAPVGSYEDGASWCGAQDLAGNVWEWVADWCGAYPAATQTNPTGPESWSGCVERVVRGGSWAVSREATRCATRIGLHPGYSDPTVGFRCASSVSGLVD